MQHFQDLLGQGPTFSPADEAALGVGLEVVLPLLGPLPAEGQSLSGLEVVRQLELLGVGHLERFCLTYKKQQQQLELN